MNDEGVESDSPFLRMIGVRLIEWRDGLARVRVEIQPHLLNRSGVVQGGVLATLLDNSAGLSGMWCNTPGNKRFGMTLSLTISYIGQAKSGAMIATGTRTAGGSKIFFADSEVRTEGGVLLARGSGVFRYRSGSESVEGRPERS